MAADPVREVFHFQFGPPTGNTRGIQRLRSRCNVSMSFQSRVDLLEQSMALYFNDDVKDGLTTTIMLAESAGRPALFRGGKQVGNLPQHIVAGGGWMRPASDFSIDGSSYDGTTLPGPCPMNCTNGDDEGGPAREPYPYYVTQGTGEAYSFHPGGANFVFGDGAVHFIHESISIRDLGRLVTRDQQEVVQAP